MKRFGTLGRLALAACVVAVFASSPALAAADPVRRVGGLLLLPVLLVAWGAFDGIVALLFPRWTATVSQAVETRRGLCLGWGAALLVLAILILLGGAAVKGPFAVIAAIIDLAVILAGVFGSVGLAAAVGSRLLPQSTPDEDRTPQQAILGGLTLSFACAVPLLGQVLALLVIVASLGAAAYALTTGRRTG